MTSTVHVYDRLTSRLVTVGLDTEKHTRATIRKLGWRAACTAVPHVCDLAAEIALYAELEFHATNLRISHPRMN